MNSKTNSQSLLLRKTSKMLSDNSGLEPYSGPWEYTQAAHLLRRCTFSSSNEHIKQVIEQGLENTIEQLFAQNPMPEPPVYYNTDTDPLAGFGESWIDIPLSSNELLPYRRKSLRAWTIGTLINEGLSIREKLTLFWHNHFAVGNISDPRFLYRHVNLLRSQAWGNFKQMVKDVSIDPAMLRFLNGNQNTENAPNENYARELLELFTIGKGPQAGPGDYTNYTEQDVVEMAKILTGWKDMGHNSSDQAVEVGSYFRPEQHDTTVKVLSPRFDNLEISDMGEAEYSYLIDIIFQKEEVARFISRKFYRWFVYYKIDDTIEMEVIEPMAQLIIDHNYDLEPALRALFSSAHFYDVLNRGPMIKNPIDFVISLHNHFDVKISEDDLEVQYSSWHQQFNKLKLMGMEYYQPPNVAGWKAYYQEPLFYRNWINATTLPERMAYTNTMAGNGYSIGGQLLQIKALPLINSFENPFDPNEVLQQLIQLLFPQNITDNQKTALKEVLLPGLPDFEWTVEYGDYAADPDNEELANAVEDKLKDLINAMLSMPEYYLS